ncbi:hypothetical protein fHeYen902_115c [Yersinia phage fHe-Yen9-02]|nr:hypothetical protein fHeYen902_115c [Yersinia phage fHe-Yen9-02]
MTAIVKHISVHPKFRYCRCVGIFDAIDQRSRLEKKKQDKKNHDSTFLYKTVPYYYPKDRVDTDKPID